jgi:hypothetical protein
MAGAVGRVASTALPMIPGGESESALNVRDPSCAEEFLFEAAKRGHPDRRRHARGVMRMLTQNLTSLTRNHSSVARNDTSTRGPPRRVEHCDAATGDGASVRLRAPMSAQGHRCDL